MKLITFTVPCYNSAAYMDRCIETLLPAGEEAEIILVDDGSSDNTGKIADDYAKKYPGIVRVIHQENGGHGEGVNQGIRNATGLFFKVVDSDDWLDAGALANVMDVLRQHAHDETPLDLVMANYVYEHVADNTRNIVNYKGILPEDRVFHWNEIGHFPPNKNILMHSVIYRTAVLRASGMVLPKHTFYVDNIFVYQPLPCVNTIYYLNQDLYRYFIGREDQSVNEKNMIKRVDQQLRVTRLMMNAVDVFALPPQQKKLRAYMLNYFSMMMAISSIFLTLDGSAEALQKRKQLWDDLKAHDERLYRRCRRSVAQGCNLPGWLGSKLSIAGYRIAQKLFKFN
ncbi:MAG TPA: glycosyltransferase [Candidatus Gemmiger excrementipullorum]|uniref:Glycosyltransferase n=1 Tax=Candidatus Gemmiger excrementipullorum TaxID=2838610 RepID=A0A9D1Y047_9FIRM|nr:glycosyltransferase [Candidatus Gemmiger excrementipullorum]